MRLWVLISVLAVLAVRLEAQAHEDDFSEFEDIDEESNQAAKSQSGEVKPPSQPAHKVEESAEEEFLVEDEDSDNPDLDFDHFQDSEEFEGHDSVQSPQSSAENNRVNQAQNEKSSDLKIKTVPFHLGNTWSSYYMELLMMGALAIYFMNFLNGRSRNANIANSWLEAHRSILENNFALVGDDGTVEMQHHGFRKEAEHCYLLWCSGRQFVEGMLVELRMIKRQCLVGVLGHMMRPASDQVIFQLTLDAMEPMVFCLASKKSTTQKFIKDFIDISTYCAERRTLPDKAARDLGDNFIVHSEIPEVTQSILQDVRIVSLLAQFKDLVELLHISDQYSPEKPNSEEIKLKRPRIERTILLHVNLPGRGRISDGEMQGVTDLLKLCLYVADKISRLKLSRESKAKADKNRQKVEEVFLKYTHAQRQEMAQQRREERIRQERERILAEDDPDKQRRLEMKEQKRLAKKNTPKLKQMKVRAM